MNIALIDYVLITDINPNALIYIHVHGQDTVNYGHYGPLREAILRGEWFSFNHLPIYRAVIEHSCGADTVTFWIGGEPIEHN